MSGRKSNQRKPCKKSGWMDFDPEYRKLLDRPNLKREEEKELILKAQGGDREAFRILLESHQKLVLSVVGPYAANARDWRDLIQEGNLGLCRAVEKFDVSRGHRFLTYAIWWVKDRVKKHFYSEQTVVPLKGGEISFMFKKKKQEGLTPLSGERLLNREGCIAQLERALYSNRNHLPTHGMRRDSKTWDISLDKPSACGDPFESCVGSVVGDIPSVESQLMEFDLQKKVHDRLHCAMRILDERERRILLYKLHLDQYAQISKEVGLSRERVRQIFVKIREKLAKTPEFEELRNAHYFEDLER